MKEYHAQSFPKLYLFIRIQAAGLPVIKIHQERNHSTAAPCHLVVKSGIALHAKQNTEKNRVGVQQDKHKNSFVDSKVIEQCGSEP